MENQEEEAPVLPSTSPVFLGKKEVEYIGPDLLIRNHNDSGRTINIVGLSYSGKTYLLTQMLNILVNKKRGGRDMFKSLPMYQRVLMFTSSPHAEPLKKIKLKSEVFQLIPVYPRKILYLLKRIQDITANRLAFLIVFDDLFQSMRNFDTVSLYLTMRNSNISVVSINQMYKALTPPARRSSHITIITKSNIADMIEVLTDGFLEPAIQLLHLEEDTPIKIVARTLLDFVNSNILVLDNKKREIKLVRRKPFA